MSGRRSAAPGSGFRRGHLARPRAGAALRGALLLVLLALPVRAQQLPVRSFTVEDGMPSALAEPFFVDRQGFLWLGSAEGLTAFDGLTFTHFGRPDGFTGAVLAAVEGAAGDLYAAGLHGVARGVRDPVFPLHVRFAPVTTPDGRPLPVASALVATRDGVIVATDSALYAVRGARAVRLRGAPVEPWGLVRGGDGGVWVRTKHAFQRLTRTGPDGYRLGGGLQLPPADANTLVSATVDAAGRVFVVRAKGALEEATPRGLVERVARRTLGPDGAHGLSAHGTTVWASGTARLVRLEAGRPPQVFTAAHGLPDTPFGAPLVAEGTGALWLSGGARTGLLRLSLAAVDRFDVATLGLPSLSHVLEHPRGTLWITGPDVVRVHLDSRGLRRAGRLRTSAPWYYDGTIPLGGDTVLVHGIDPARPLLWARAGEHPLRVRPIPIAYPPGNPARTRTHVHLLTALRSRDGTIWLAHNGLGLYRGRLHHGPRGLTLVVTGFYDAIRGVRTLAETPDGALWAGDYEGGLLRVGPDGQARLFTARDGLADLHVRSLAVTPEGTLWVGTRYAGLLAYRAGRFYPYPGYDGLRSTTVWSLLPEPDGSLWMGTEQGLKWMRPAPGLRVPVPVQHVGRGDGIPAVPVYRLARGADGRVLAATSPALYAAPPAQLRPKGAPPLYLRHVQAGGQEVQPAQPGRPAHLRPGQGTVTFAYGAVAPADAQAVRYTYRLRGVSEVWSAPTAQRAVTFAQLAPGRYTFEVAIPAGAGVTQGPGATFAFTVAAPFYQTAWFAALVGFGLASLAYAAHAARLRRLLAVARVRGRIASDLHDDVGTTLTRISLFSDVALADARRVRERTPDDARLGRLVGMLEEIGTSARALIEGVGEIVWSEDPRHDTGEDLALRVKAYTSRLLEARGIDYVVEAAPALAALHLRPDLRRACFLIFKEALTNAVRHSGAARIRVDVRREGRALLLQVEDDGCGLPAGADTSGGHGLHNMRTRAAPFGGTVDVAPRPGGGTCVTARLPLR